MKARWQVWLGIAIALSVGLTVYAGRPEVTPVGTAAAKDAQHRGVEA